MTTPLTQPRRTISFTATSPNTIHRALNIALTIIEAIAASTWRLPSSRLMLVANGGRLRVAEKRSDRRISAENQCRSDPEQSPEEYVPTDFRIGEVAGQQPRPRHQVVRPELANVRLERQIQQPQTPGAEERISDRREEAVQLDVHVGKMRASAQIGDEWPRRRPRVDIRNAPRRSPRPLRRL